MRRANLGQSGLSVPRICLGTNNFGGGQLTEDTATRIMTHALDLGIDFIDTADVYTEGDAEKIIGRFAKERRNDVIIATKAGREGDGRSQVHPNYSSVSRINLIYRIEESLNKMQTDYIDLFYVHKFDPDVPLEETMRTLDSLVKEGKIRYIACSNYSARQIAESDGIAESLGLESFIAVQNQYNLFEREMEREVIPYCAKNGVGTLAYSPLAGGVLAGRYNRNSLPPSGSRATYRSADWLADHVDDEKFSKLDKIKKVASSANISLPVLSLSWTLNQVTTAVVGASVPEQLDECVNAADTTLPTEVLDDLNLL